MDAGAIKPDYNLVQDPQMNNLGAKVFYQRFGKSWKSERETLKFIQDIGLADTPEKAQRVVQGMIAESVRYKQFGPIKKRFQLVQGRDAIETKVYKLESEINVDL
jgi:hypothetical protein